MSKGLHVRVGSLKRGRRKVDRRIYKCLQCGLSLTAPMLFLYRTSPTGKPHYKCPYCRGEIILIDAKNSNI